MRFSNVLPLAAAPYAFAGNLRRTGHAAAPVEAPAYAPAPAPAPAGHDAMPAGHAAPYDEGMKAPAGHAAPPAGHAASPVEAPAAVPGHAGMFSSVDAIVIWVKAGAGAEKEVIQEHAAPPTVTHEVVVGGEQGLSYFPQEVAAQVGDMVVFTFYAMNHTVTQSTFDSPCSAMEGGMDSGFMPNPDDSIDPAPQVAMQVMSEAPIWLYCKQGNHCGQGMVFSINPNGMKSHAQFQAAAIAQKGEGADTAIVGGEGVPAETGDQAEEPMETAQDTAAEEAPVETVASSAAALPTQAEAAPSEPAGGAAMGGVVMGNGVMAEDGSCMCAVQCAGGSFPNPGSQGVNAFGGVAGSINMAGAGGAEGGVEASGGEAAPEETGSEESLPSASEGEASEATGAEGEDSEEQPEEGGEQAEASGTQGAEDASQTGAEEGAEEVQSSPAAEGVTAAAAPTAADEAPAYPEGGEAAPTAAAEEAPAYPEGGEAAPPAAGGEAPSYPEARR